MAMSSTLSSPQVKFHSCPKDLGHEDLRLRTSEKLGKWEFEELN